MNSGGGEVPKRDREPEETSRALVLVENGSTVASPTQTFPEEMRRLWAERLRQLITDDNHSVIPDQS